jgi:hypothetical protein
MPNATVRANARSLPEATDPAAVHKDSARIEAFSRAYARWLTARAQLEDKLHTSLMDATMEQPVLEATRNTEPR